MSNKKVSQICEGRSLEISQYDHVKSNKCKPIEVKWAKLRDRLLRHKRISASTEQYKNAPLEQKRDLKDGAWISSGHYLEDPKLRKGPVGKSHVLILDMDNAPKHSKKLFDEKLSEYTAVVYSTLSHSEVQAKFRIVLPLKEPIDGVLYAPLSRAIANRIGIDYFDSTSHQAGRAMYLPTCCNDANPIALEYTGQWLDADAILSSDYRDPYDVSEWPRGSNEQKISRGTGRLEDPRDKTGRIGAFCRAYSIHQAIKKFLPDHYVEGVTQNRYTFSGSQTVNGAIVYDDIHLHSHHSHDPISDRTVNAYDLVRIHLFGKYDENSKAPATSMRLPSNIRMRELCERDENVQREMVKANIDRSAKDIFQNLDELDDEAFDGMQEILDREDLEDDTWISKLKLNINGDIIGTHANVMTILENDVLLKGRLGFNEMSGLQVRLRNLPWAKCIDPANGDSYSDRDDAMLRYYLTRRYKMNVSDLEVHRGAKAAAYQHPFHPVKSYLNSLNWDGTPRLTTMLYDYLGVERNEYTLAVSRKVLVAAVARIMEPGCKFDTMIVLHGKTGTGKSTFARTLAVNDKWFTDDIHQYQGKEVVESLQGCWIVELSELQNVRHTDVAIMKSFLSRQEDRCRLSYERYAGSYPRQCVMIGTTNEDTYLTDTTGNRRFWPVTVRLEGFLDIARLRDNLDQLWAEAYVMYVVGESLKLDSDEEKKLAVEAQEERRDIDERVDIISSWLDRPVHADYLEAGNYASSEEMVLRDRCCYEQIMVDCLGMNKASLRPGHQKLFTRLMKEVPGWEHNGNTKLNMGPRYGYRRGYVRTDQGATGMTATDL